MHDQWIYRSGVLPNSGEPIEFRLEEREQPIPGTFADDVFHSRWADYGSSRVGSWRSLDSDPSACPIEAPTSTAGSFARIFKRLKDMISTSRDSHPTAPPRNRARTAAMAATTLPASSAIARSI